MDTLPLPSALVGYSGFVGSTLLRQRAFDFKYRSTNIDDIRGKQFGLVICAAAPAQKWIANANPAEDEQKIDALIDRLRTITCDQFVLISTVDVYEKAVNVDESDMPTPSEINAYGRNRLKLEKFVESHFPKHLVVRLPGLVGPGLRKNVIFDFLNSNRLEFIESRGVFQFYPMVNLWSDIKRALNANLSLLHLTSEPTSVSEIAAEAFGMHFDQPISDSPATYDLRSKFGDLYGSSVEYQYTKKEVLMAIRAYAQSEPLSSLKND